MCVLCVCALCVCFVCALCVCVLCVCVLCVCVRTWGGLLLVWTAVVATWLGGWWVPRKVAGFRWLEKGGAVEVALKGGQV